MSSIQTTSSASTLPGVMPLGSAKYDKDKIDTMPLGIIGTARSIFQYLGLKDQLTMAAVCRQTRDLVLNNYVFVTEFPKPIWIAQRSIKPCETKYQDNSYLSVTFDDGSQLTIGMGAAIRTIFSFYRILVNNEIRASSKPLPIMPPENPKETLEQLIKKYRADLLVRYDQKLCLRKNERIIWNLKNVSKIIGDTLMKQYEENPTFMKSLENIAREGARKVLTQAIENEVEEFVKHYSDRRDSNGHLVVKRNGYLPERTIQTGIGSIPIKKPRTRGEKFTSAILPTYLRRAPSIDALIPALYLRGISTGDMKEALTAILGDRAKGLSPANISKLMKAWEDEHKEWQKRDLSEKEYVYFWADGIYFNVRLTDDRPCILVIIGALADGKKEMVAIYDGERESVLSWKTVLQNLKSRGLQKGPKLAIGDGAMGFWSALEEEFPSCEHQRCWVHKTANILDKMPRSVQVDAKAKIHDIYMAPTQKEGLRAYSSFLSLYEKKYPKACQCLAKDKESLFSFYDYPAEHWQHIRTTNPIESTFATIRHRTKRTKGCGSRAATLSMVFKLALTAESKWRRLRGSKEIIKVLTGIKFKDGEEVKKVA